VAFTTEIRSQVTSLVGSVERGNKTDVSFYPTFFCGIKVPFVGRAVSINYQSLEYAIPVIPHGKTHIE